MMLHEKYRPRQWSEVVGQDKAVRQIQRLAERGGLGGRAFWLSGQSGTGKTTIGRLIAGEVASDFNIDEVDATDLSAARVREIERDWHTFGIGEKPGRAYLINEAHGLRKDTVRQLLTVLERLPAHVVVIFTTTTEGELSLFDDQIDAHPLLSRCVELTLSRRGLAEAFAQRAHEIASAEELNVRPVSSYVNLAKRCRTVADDPARAPAHCDEGEGRTVPPRIDHDKGDHPMTAHDELQIGPRTTIRRGDWFRATAGPYWSGRDSQGRRVRQPMTEPGPYKFLRLVGHRRKRWIEAINARGQCCILMLTSYRSQIDGIVGRPYRITGKAQPPRRRQTSRRAA